MSNSQTLYERDFFLWTVEQARLLRDVAKAGTDLPLEWDHLAEEIESLGVSERRELRSRIATIIEHLLKLEFSPAADPRRGWEETIGREQRDIRLLLANSPSLKVVVGPMLADECRSTGRLVARILIGRGEIAGAEAEQLKRRTYTEHEVLGEEPVA